MAITEVRNPAPPNLPFAPQAYESRYNEQLNNVLRLYFNQLNNAVAVQTANENTLQAEIDALNTSYVEVLAATQRNQTLIWLNM